MSQVILRALRARIAEVIRAKKLLIGQAILTTDAANKALLVATGPDSCLEFMPTSERCFFSYYLSSTQALTLNTYTVVKVNTAYISNSNVDTSTGLFTAPVAGFYFFSGVVYISSTTAMIKTLGFTINGNHYPMSKVPSSTTSGMLNGTYGPVFLNAGDTVGLMVHCSAANTLPAMAASSPFLGSYFSGWRIA